MVYVYAKKVNGSYIDKKPTIKDYHTIGHREVDLRGVKTIIRNISTLRSQRIIASQMWVKAAIRSKLNAAYIASAPKLDLENTQ